MNFFKNPLSPIVVFLAALLIIIILSTSNFVTLYEPITLFSSVDAIANIIIACLSACGFILLWQTLVATRKALKEAEKTTQLALKTAQATSAEKRPWITIEANTTGVQNIDLDRGCLKIKSIKIIIENKGSTPATNISSNIFSYISFNSLYGNHDRYKIDKPGNILKTKYTLMPGESLELTGDVVVNKISTTTLMHQMMNIKNNLFFIIDIEFVYSSLFSSELMTTKSKFTLQSNTIDFNSIKSSQSRIQFDIKNMKADILT